MISISTSLGRPFYTGLLFILIIEVSCERYPNAEIRFNNKVVNLGKIDSSSVVDNYLVYENMSAVNLRIDTIVTTCGCTVAESKSEDLLPGKTDSFQVRYTPAGEGPFQREIVVYSDSISSPDHLYLKGTIINAPR